MSDFFPPVAGGLEFHVQALAHELTRRHHDVRVVTLTENPVPGDGYEVSTPATSVRLLPHERSERPFHPPLPDPVARHSLRRVIAEFRPDVVHAHSWLAASLPHGKAPLVFTAHDYAQICQRRTLLKPGLIRCAGPELRTCIDCGSEIFGRAKSTLLAPATVVGRRLLRPARVVAVSSAVREALAPYVTAPIEVVPNFVAPTPPPATLPEQLGGTGYVMYAGDSAAHKGVGDLLEVWSGPQAPGAALVLATPTPVAGVLPPSAVNVSLSRAQVLTAMARAAVVVVPSLWGEPCPTVVLEAMQVGTPVVGSGVGGIPDLVVDGETGLLFPPGDTAQLAGAIGRLLSSPGFADALGRAARVRAESFTVAVVAQRLTAIYRELADATPTQEDMP